MTAIYSGLCTWPCTSLPRFLYIWLAICTNNMVKLLYTSCWSRDRQHLCSAAHHQLTVHHLIMYCILNRWPSDFQCSVRSVAWPLTQHGNHYTYAVQWLPVRRWVDFKMATLGPCLPVTVRHGSSLSSHRLLVGLRWRSLLDVFCHIKDVCCETNIQQQLLRQVFSAASPKLWSSLPTELRQADMVIVYFSWINS